jgi:hypothetical protein
MIDPFHEIERQRKSLMSIDIIEIVYDVIQDTIYFDITSECWIQYPFDIFFNPVI